MDRKEKEETIKHIKKRIKMKRRKSPTGKEEMKGGGIEKERGRTEMEERQRRNKTTKKNTTKERTQKSGKKRWENKHGKGRGRNERIQNI